MFQAGVLSPTNSPYPEIFYFSLSSWNGGAIGKRDSLQVFIRLHTPPWLPPPEWKQIR